MKLMKGVGLDLYVYHATDSRKLKGLEAKMLPSVKHHFVSSSNYLMSSAVCNSNVFTIWGLDLIIKTK